MPRQKINDQYFIFRPRIYLPKKYQELERFLTSFYQGRNIISALLEKLLDETLFNTTKDNWESKIFEVLRNRKTEKPDSLFSSFSKEISPENPEESPSTLDLLEAIEKF
ncbi:MAG: hypothetical protein QXL51_07710 [Candidatus Aenigmatarchaeota archaeon]